MRGKGGFFKYLTSQNINFFASQVHDLIEVYENTLFHFVKGEIQGSRGPNRASVTQEERQELEKAG